VIRYGASQIGVGTPMQMLQDNLVAWFYAAFIHRVGTYLIEVNSGRLRVGAKRYKQLVAQARSPEVADSPAAEGGPQEPSSNGQPVSTVTITILGQVKAGKSSLINALLGERRAGTDVLPLTNEITRYQLQPAGIGNTLTLLDTVGYGHEGPGPDQLKATQQAAKDSDLILLVLHGRDPARQPDLKLMQDLRAWFRSQPDLRMPPILGVMSHIDLLPPLLEWSPPYNWLKPARPKEKSIAAARETIREALGDHLVEVVPICGAAGKVYGVEEWLLPRTVELLGEARAVSLLRCLKAEANAGKIRKLLGQLLEASKQVWHVTMSGQPLSPPPPR
jgi:predicted GTPase